MEDIPHRPDLDLGSLLQPHDLDRVMGVVTSLATEVIQLEVRVASLEGATPADLQERIDGFIARVFSPLAGPDS